MIVIRNLMRRKLRTALSILGVGVGISLMVTLFTLSNDILGQISSILKDDRGDLMVFETTGDIWNSRVDRLRNGREFAEELGEYDEVKGAYPMIFSWIRTESSINASNQIDYYGVTNDHPVTEALATALDEAGKPMHIAPGEPLIGGEDSFIVGKVLFDLANARLPEPMKMRVGQKVDLASMLLADFADMFGEDARTFGELSANEKLERSKAKFAQARIDGDAVAKLSGLTLRAVFTAKQKAMEASLVFPLGLAQDVKGFRKAGKDEVTFFLIDLEDESDSGKEAALESLSKRYPSLRIERSDKVLSGMSEVDLISKFNWAVSIIAAIAGALGVMNILVLSVTERTREIGLLRALGWSRRRIVRSIMAEGVVITVLGAFAGVGIGYIEMVCVIHFLDFSLVSARIDLLYVGVAIAVAFVLGIFASIYPAWRASRLTPMDALRQE